MSATFQVGSVYTRPDEGLCLACSESEVLWFAGGKPHQVKPYFPNRYKFAKDVTVEDLLAAWKITIELLDATIQPLLMAGFKPSQQTPNVGRVRRRRLTDESTDDARQRLTARLSRA